MRNSTYLAVAVVLLAVLGNTAVGQQRGVQSHQPSHLTAPERVGRFVRGEAHDFGTATGGVGYRYLAGSRPPRTLGDR